MPSSFVQSSNALSACRSLPSKLLQSSSSHNLLRSTSSVTYAHNADAVDLEVNLKFVQHRCSFCSLSGLSARLHLSYTLLLMRTFVVTTSIANRTTPVVVKRHQGPSPVRILRWCFPFTDVLSVCTDIEFNVCGICVRLSTFSESFLGQNK